MRKEYFVNSQGKKVCPDDMSEDELRWTLNHVLRVARRKSDRVKVCSWRR